MPPPTLVNRGGPKALKTRPGGGVSGKTILGGKRHRKVLKETIYGITKPAIRRLARRGGVKRISGDIYDEVRQALKARLRQILQDCVTYTEYRRAKTVTVSDVIFSLRRIGRPIYGFDPDTHVLRQAKRHVDAVDAFDD
ncbi:hypothetical protein NKR23_g4561 [Pleurostoma richardsiae]|uniref:Histone H4 n=1 Tax=Pleurostoma richardsiae TaxID=41990 RepID=A0AA38VK98_9PEZI|nr:hypothetical protein NKR23_g4561 [Pleurostoma richardsiae]